jgi:hypothetical protein
MNPNEAKQTVNNPTVGCRVKRPLTNALATINKITVPNSTPLTRYKPLAAGNARMKKNRVYAIPAEALFENPMIA